MTCPTTATALASAVPSTLRIATRVSALAMWQTRWVQSKIAALYPEITIEVLGLSTRGDQILDRSLAKIGGKGLFIKELEQAMADGQADLAVHSLKDVPMVLPEGYTLAAILPREDPLDALVGPGLSGLEDLPHGARVGTSSLRRQAQLLALRPDLEVLPLRGNVQTRLAKLDAGEYHAIVLAAAGLMRLGLSERIACRLAPEQSLPAASQGAIAIECRSDRPELLALLAALHDAPTARCVTAERALSRRLGGSCQLPLAAFAQEEGVNLHLRARLLSPDGQQAWAAQAQGQDPEALGLALAEKLLAQGAEALLQQLQLAADQEGEAPAGAAPAR